VLDSVNSASILTADQYVVFISGYRTVPAGDRVDALCLSACPLARRRLYWLAGHCRWMYVPLM